MKGKHTANSCQLLFFILFSLKIFVLLEKNLSLWCCYDSEEEYNYNQYLAYPAFLSFYDRKLKSGSLGYLINSETHYLNQHFYLTMFGM